MVGQVATANTFGYNARSEVTGATMGANTYNYGYDSIGNRVAATNNAETFAYFANALNQYTNIADGVSVSPTYDADGNMVSYGPWAFTWDAENRMASAVSNGVLMVTNVYDHLSRRIKKVSRGGAESAEFLYDGWNPVREITSQVSGTSTNYYTWGLDLSGTTQGAGSRQRE